MILRLAVNGAVHTAGGVAMGITMVLAACTVAQVANRGRKRLQGTVETVRESATGSGAPYRGSNSPPPAAAGDAERY